METKLTSQDVAYERAATRVNDLKKFYTSAVVFACVMGFLFLLKAVHQSQSYGGLLWIGGFWGFFLAVRALKLFVLGDDWENRKINEIMNQQKQ